MGEDDSLEIPGSDAFEGLGRCLGIVRVEAVLRRCHRLRSDAPESRKRPPEDGRGLAVEVLDEVGHDQGARGSVKEDDLREEDVAADFRLVELGGPTGIRLIAENAIEGEVGAPLGEPRGGEDLCPWIGVDVVADRQMVDLVGRDDEGDLTEAVEIASDRGIERYGGMDE